MVQMALLYQHYSNSSWISWPAFSRRSNNLPRRNLKTDRSGAAPLGSTSSNSNPGRLGFHAVQYGDPNRENDSERESTIVKINKKVGIFFESTSEHQQKGEYFFENSYECTKNVEIWHLSIFPTLMYIMLKFQRLVPSVKPSVKRCGFGRAQEQLAQGSQNHEAASLPPFKLPSSQRYDIRDISYYMM